MSNPIDDSMAEHQASLQALRAVLEPLARLGVARGVTVQEVEEMLRQAFVAAARQACEPGPAHRLTSRISTITGLNRREVARLQASTPHRLPATRSHASALVTRWLSLPEFTAADGQPAVLPRDGSVHSFDALAASVTRDVHPGTLLAELQRLHLVDVDADAGRVRLLVDALVPRGDWPRMVRHLGTNVGEHLASAVDNVLGQGSEHFDQALLADELSAESVQHARALISAQWRSLLTTLGPQLEALMAADRAAGRVPDQQVRVGLYSRSQPMPGPSDCPPSSSSSSSLTFQHGDDAPT